MEIAGKMTLCVFVERHFHRWNCQTQGGVVLDTVIDCQDDDIPIDLACPPPPALLLPPSTPPPPPPDASPSVTIAAVVVESSPLQVDVVLSTSVPLSLFQFTIGTVSPASQLFSPIDLSEVLVTLGPSFNPNNVTFQIDGSSSAGVVFAFSTPLTEAIVLPGQDQVVLTLDLSALGPQTDSVCLEVRIRRPMAACSDSHVCADGFHDVCLWLLLIRPVVVVEMHMQTIHRTSKSVARMECRF